VIALCTCCKPRTGYPFAFFCGLFLDFFSTKLFGYNAFSFTLAALLVYSVSDQLYFEELPSQMIATFCLTFLVSITNNALVMLLAASTIWAGWYNVFFGALFGTLVAPLVFALVFRLFGKREAGIV
jgi:rod shape-determining protein MreD